MSRKPPTDTFTRFTSTSPHASQKSQSSFSPSSQAFNGSSSTETPTQRVARLRAAHAAAKARRGMSLADRIIDRGRLWADMTHRFTAYTLLGLTGLAACVSAYGLGSLVVHNRRQKRAWIEREMGRLHDARAAFLRGEADAEQLHLLEQERAGEEMMEKRVKEVERKKQEGIWNKAKALVGRGTSVGEMGREDQMRSVGAGGSERLLEDGWVAGEVQTGTPQQRPAMQSREEAVRAVSTGIQGVGLDSKGRPVPIDRAVKEHNMTIQERWEAERRSGEQEVTARTGVIGGPLDVLAGNVVGAVVDRGANDWLSWVRGGKS